MSSGASTVALAQDDIAIAGVLINTQDPFRTPNMDAAQIYAVSDAAVLSQPDGLFGISTAPNQFIAALIAQSPAQIGAQSVQAIVDYLQAGNTGAVPASDEFVGIPQRLLTADNVDDPANADYIYKPQCD